MEHSMVPRHARRLLTQRIQQARDGVGQGISMMRYPRSAVVGIALALIASAPGPAAAGGPVAPVQKAAFAAGPLASHQAIYDLSLTKVNDSEGVRAAKGSMVYTLTDRCDGYTIESNLLMAMAFSNGVDNQVDQRYAGWEAKDGRSSTFRMQVFENKTLTKAYHGSVQLNEDGSGTATYESDAIVKFDLPPGTLLSTAHTTALLNSVAAGDHFFSRPVIDGSFEDGPFLITAAIGASRRSDSTSERGGTGELGSGNYWPVEMAYFPLSSGRDVPSYEIMMNLLQNGIARGMTQDFGGFAFGFELIRVEPVAVPHC